MQEADRIWQDGNAKKEAADKIVIKNNIATRKTVQAKRQVTSAKIRTISAQVEKRLRQQDQEYEATMTLQSMKHQSKLSKQQSNFSSDMDDAMGKILALTGEVRDNDALIQELKKQ